MAKPLIPMGESRRLNKRKIREETCAKFKYTISEDDKGNSVQVENYFVEGQLVAQKLRYPNKDFVWRGDPKAAGLFGQHLWRSGGRKLVITEGAIDCLSVSQVQQNKWPVVSVKNGAGGAVKDILQELEWVSSFEEIVLLFDMDESGQEAAKAVALVLPPGKVKIGYMPMKDANDLLQAGEDAKILDAIWEAKPFRPDGLVQVSDLKTLALKPVEWGLPWPYPELTDATYGRRRKELYFFGAGTGIGKTDFMLELAEFNYRECKLPTGLIFLETPPVETLVRLAGKFANKPFHIPDAGWQQEELQRTLDDMEESNAFTFYDHHGAGAADWEGVKSKIRYMVQALGIKDIILDHLTALAAFAEDERKTLEALCADLGSLVHELDCTLYVVSHLATPDGTPHEEGGRVMIRHFKGSRAIGYWAHFMFGMERHTQHEDPEVRRITTFRCLKDRYTGRANGFTMHYRQNPLTYRNESCPPPPKEEKGKGKDYGFKNEAPTDDSDY